MARVLPQSRQTDPTGIFIVDKLARAKTNEEIISLLSYSVDRKMEEEPQSMKWKFQRIVLCFIKDISLKEQ